MPIVGFASGMASWRWEVSLTLKLLTVGASTVILSAYLWSRRRQIVGYVAIGPYPTALVSGWARGLQRALVDWTRRDVEIDWYPANFSPTMTPRRASDNGHPVSGAVRDAARTLIMDAIDALGGKKFEISPGKRTSYDGRFVHQHYAVDDLHAPVQQEYPVAGEVVVCIDVDYYLTNPDDYFGVECPIILHTFSPRKVAGMDGDSPFRIMGDEVHYQVSGGANWTHQVWDWCGFGEFLEFNVRITNVWQWLLSCVGIRKVLYQKVHHARPWSDCRDRALVWCLPQRTCYRFTWLKHDLHARRLKRIKFSDDSRPGWNSLVSLDDDNQLMISFGRQGEDATVEMPKVHFDVLMGLQSSQSVTSRMIGFKYTDPAVLALTGQYYRKGVADAPDCHRVARPSNVRVHWPAAIEAELPETSARSYAGALVTDENLVPMIKRWEVLSTSLERRVEFVRNSKVPPRKYQRYAEEFVRLVVPIAGEGVPLSLEGTAEQLDKPSQVLAVKQIWETVDMPCRRLIECFLKNEPCMKPGRIISSFADARFLLCFSSYTLRFRDEVLHSEDNQKWFCPGSTPERIAERVTEYVSRVDEPSEGDYSNLDGSVSSWLQRRVMNAVYLRYFHRRYHKDLVVYLEMLVNCPARAKRFNFQYDAGVGVKSGSPTTCDLNTVCGGFVQYCAVRDTLPDLEPKEAFQLLGLAFGDDGLFDRRFRNAWVRAAGALGLTLKVEPFVPAEGVCFLARVFPDPWNTTTSFQDPLRTWRKLHLTFRDPNIPVATAAVDRVEGYLVTDSLTPVTSDYCRMVVRTLGPSAESVEVRHSRKTVDREKPYWLTVGGSWPQAERDVPLMLQCISARTGIDAEKLQFVAAQLQSAATAWSFPAINRDDEPNPYRDTLDIDAQPADGEVDLRTFSSDQHVQRGRANPGVPRPPEGANGSGGGPSHSRDKGRHPGRGQGSQGVRELPEQPRIQGAKRRGRTDGQTPDGQGAGKRPVRSVRLVDEVGGRAPTRPARGTGRRPRV